MQRRLPFLDRMNPRDGRPLQTLQRVMRLRSAEGYALELRRVLYRFLLGYGLGVEVEVGVD